MVIFKCSDANGSRKTFLDPAAFAKWAKGRRGIVIEVADVDMGAKRKPGDTIH